MTCPCDEVIPLIFKALCTIHSTSHHRRKTNHNNDNQPTIRVKIPKFTTATNIQIHHFTDNTIQHSSVQGPLIAGVPFDSVGRFRASLLLRTNCMRSQRLGGTSSMAAIPTNKQTNKHHWGEPGELVT